MPSGGNYDGDVGSPSAIEVARTLGVNKLVTKLPPAVVIFQNEEGGTVDSRALVGEVTTEDLSLKTTSGKTTIGDGITFTGGDLAKLATVKGAPGDVAAYVELHIEQGGNLDREKLDIGVAEGTVGRVQAFPGVPNVIPGKVVFTLEIRDLDQAKVEALAAKVRAEGEAIGRATGCTFSYSPLHHSRPAACDERVKQVIETSARTGPDDEAPAERRRPRRPAPARLGPAG